MRIGIKGGHHGLRVVVQRESHPEFSARAGQRNPLDIGNPDVADEEVGRCHDARHGDLDFRFQLRLFVPPAVLDSAFAGVGLRDLRGGTVHIIRTNALPSTGELVCDRQLTGFGDIGETLPQQNSDARAGCRPQERVAQEDGLRCRTAPVRNVVSVDVSIAGAHGEMQLPRQSVSVDLPHIRVPGDDNVVRGRIAVRVKGAIAPEIMPQPGIQRDPHRQVVRDGHQRILREHLARCPAVVHDVGIGDARVGRRHDPAGPVEPFRTQNARTRQVETVGSEHLPCVSARAQRPRDSGRVQRRAVQAQHQQRLVDVGAGDPPQQAIVAQTLQHVHQRPGEFPSVAPHRETLAVSGAPKRDDHRRLPERRRSLPAVGTPEFLQRLGSRLGQPCLELAEGVPIVFRPDDPSPYHPVGVGVRQPLQRRERQVSGAQHRHQRESRTRFENHPAAGHPDPSGRRRDRLEEPSRVENAGEVESEIADVHPLSGVAGHEEHRPTRLQCGHERRILQHRATGKRAAQLRDLISALHPDRRVGALAVHHHHDRPARSRPAYVELPGRRGALDGGEDLRRDGSAQEAEH
ncbi:hypothetical protein GCM10009565_52880 [Amycolatopsis albidoflavus]